MQTPRSLDVLSSTRWDLLSTGSRLLWERRSLLLTASRSIVWVRFTLRSTLPPALLLLGSQSSTRWTGFFWCGTSLGIWEFSPTTTLPTTFARQSRAFAGERHQLVLDQGRRPGDTCAACSRARAATRRVFGHSQGSSRLCRGGYSSPHAWTVNEHSLCGECPTVLPEHGTAAALCLAC